MNQLEFSFDDEPVGKSCYDITRKRIELVFAGYYDLKSNGQFINKHCRLIIENWSSAFCKIGDNPKTFELESQLGIFKIILYMKFNNNNLELLVNTMDDRFLTLFFDNPILNLE